MYHKNLLKPKWGSKASFVWENGMLKFKEFGITLHGELSFNTMLQAEEKQEMVVLWMAWEVHGDQSLSVQEDVAVELWAIARLFQGALQELHSKIGDLVEETSSYCFKLTKFLSYLLSWDSFHVWGFELAASLTFLAGFSLGISVLCRIVFIW